MHKQNTQRLFSVRTCTKNWVLQSWQQLLSSGDTEGTYSLFVSSSALFLLEHCVTSWRGGEKKKGQNLMPADAPCFQPTSINRLPLLHPNVQLGVFWSCGNSRFTHRMCVVCHNRSSFAFLCDPWIKTLNSFLLMCLHSQLWTECDSLVISADSHTNSVTCVNYVQSLKQMNNVYTKTESCCFCVFHSNLYMWQPIYCPPQQNRGLPGHSVWLSYIK